MRDTDLTPNYELASAYVDNDVTAAERAQVEASPELLGLVATMRSLGTALASVPSPPAPTRESAIAAALDAFDGQSATVVPLTSRRRWTKVVLAPAAALVLLGAVAISLSNNDSGRGEDSSATRAADTKIDESAGDGVAADQAPASESVVLTAQAPLTIELPEELLAIPLPPDADDSEAVACLGDTQVFLAWIYYQGTLAIAVRDTVTGVTEAIEDTCTVLARATP